MPGPVTIRPESSADRAAVYRVNETAFDTAAEARLVYTLRRDADPLVSLVAERDGEIIGHVLFSPVSLDDHPGARVMGLAPMAVLPAHQGEGIGAMLVEAGLGACRALGADAVIVLGHPGYYPRFGFAPASRFGIHSTWEVPDEAFMALELEPGCLEHCAGVARYHPAFDTL